MSDATDLEKVETPAELEQFSRGALEDEELVLPIVQLTQQLSNAVTEGDVDSGHYYNALTGDDYGEGIDFVPVHYFRGRFLEQDNQVYVAQGDVAPDNWPEEYAGQAFESIPDAEETFKTDVNAGVRDWGSGPPIRTTYNYVGFRPEEPEVPIRLSLMRTSAPAAKKINTLLRFEKQNWDRVIELKAEEKSKNGRPYHVHAIKRGRPTTAEEKQQAIEFAQAILNAGGGRLAGDESASAAPAKPVANEEALGVN